MALDKNDLISLIQTNLPDNTSADITPSKVRQVEEQCVTSAANLAETTKQVFAGEIEYPNQGSVGYTNSGTFISTATQSGVIDVATTVTFGAGGSTTGNHVSVGSDGVITVNTDSYLSVKQRFRAGRVGASGASDLFFWAEISADDGATWSVLGNSVDISLENASSTVVFFDLSTVFLPAGTKIRNKFARSSDGDDSGDLIPKTPSATLAALGVPIAPSAQITIYRIEQ